MDVPRFIAELLTWQRVPGHHQGRTRAGVDCLGLLLAGMAEQGIAPDVPADYHPSAAAALLATYLSASPLLEQRSGPPAPGNVLLFRIRRSVQHLAVALGPDTMIHATQPHGVAVVTISALWRQRLVACYGWVPHG